MAARRLSTPQTEFWRGELRPELTGLTDPRKVLQGLRTATNARPLTTGQLSRRYGTVFVSALDGQAVLADYVTAAGTDLILAFSDTKMESFRLTDGFKVGELTGAPWVTADLSTLTFAADNNKLYVASQSFWPRVLEFDESAQTWSISKYAFGDGLGNSKLQPYFKFDDAKDITLAVDAYSGSGVTVTASADIFTSDHVGARLRYVFRELDITGFTDAQNVTADVVDELPPSYDVTVDDASGFRIGEVVVGADSGAEGRIIGINFGTNVVQMVITKGYEGPEDTEELDGPSHTSEINGTPSKVATPPATLIWDEQFLSDARGYPGAVSIFRRRLCFVDWPQKEAAIFLSASNDFNDGDVEGGTARDAILDFVKGAKISRVFYAVEAENLILLGDDRVWYVPDDNDVGDITPASISFAKVEETGAAQVNPVIFGDTVTFVEAGGNRIMGVVPTGQLRRPWRLEDLSRDNSHLLSSPVALGVTAGNDEAPERYMFAVNGDGTIAAMHRHNDVDDSGLRRDIIGWFPWETEGSWKSIASVRGIVYAALTRDISGDTWMVERFEQGRHFDSAAVESAHELISWVDSAGNNIVDSADNDIVTSQGGLGHLAGETVAVIDGNRDYGDFTVDADGLISDERLDGVSYDAGLAFTVTVSPFVVSPEDSRRKGTRRTAVKKFAVDVYETVGLTVNGEPLHRSTWDDLDSDPAPLTGIFWVRVLGVVLGQHDVSITQPRPGALTIRALMAEVAY
ncbi:MAG: hypothetical protein ACLFV8_11925 [Alphaproteobacteria bacterium]